MNITILSYETSNKSIKHLSTIKCNMIFKIKQTSMN